MKHYDKQVQLNTRALLLIIDSIQFLVKQGLGLRGSNWDKGSKRENGNFTSLLEFLCKYSADLKSHLHSSPKNARNSSPKIQNELIRINGDLIRQSVVKQCNASPFWSVMADEAMGISTTEQLSVCVLNVWEKVQLNLRFVKNLLGFAPIGAEDIISAIVELSSACGLNMARLVGKEFDGASNMSGHVSGVSAQLKELHPNGRYLTYCRNHVLNLVNVASCNSVPDVRKIVGKHLVHHMHSMQTSTMKNLHMHGSLDW